MCVPQWEYRCNIVALQPSASIDLYGSTLAAGKSASTDKLRSIIWRWRLFIFESCRLRFEFDLGARWNQCKKLVDQCTGIG